MSIAPKDLSIMRDPKARALSRQNVLEAREAEHATRVHVRMESYLDLLDMADESQALQEEAEALREWRAGVEGALTICYPPRVGPHTEGAYITHAQRYHHPAMEEYRQGADVVAAAVEVAKRKAVEDARVEWMSAVPAHDPVTCVCCRMAAEQRDRPGTFDGTETVPSPGAVAVTVRDQSVELRFHETAERTLIVATPGGVQLACSIKAVGDTLKVYLPEPQSQEEAHPWRLLRYRRRP